MHEKFSPLLVLIQCMKRNKKLLLLLQQPQWDFNIRETQVVGTFTF